MRDGEEQRPCRILLVDDSESYRTALSKLLSREKDVYIVGEAADGRAALELTLKLRPDVLIMDVMMPRKQSLRRYKRVAKGRCLPRGPRAKERTDSHSTDRPIPKHFPNQLPTAHSSTTAGKRSLSHVSSQ